MYRVQCIGLSDPEVEEGEGLNARTGCADSRVVELADRISLTASELNLLRVSRFILLLGVHCWSLSRDRVA